MTAKTDTVRKPCRIKADRRIGVADLLQAAGAGRRRQGLAVGGLIPSLGDMFVIRRDRLAGLFIQQQRRGLQGGDPEAQGTYVLTQKAGAHLFFLA
jgi:hypothetical protein